MAKSEKIGKWALIRVMYEGTSVIGYTRGQCFSEDITGFHFRIQAEDVNTFYSKGCCTKDGFWSCSKRLENFIWEK